MQFMVIVTQRMHCSIVHTMPIDRGFRMPGSRGSGGDITVHVELLARSLMQKQGEAAEEQRQAMARSHRLSRVPVHLRDNNANEYTPRFVAIGPLHSREDRRLRPAERLKVAYFNSLISRGYPDPADHLTVIQEYILVVAAREQEARAMYIGEEVVEIPPHDFIQMMVLDGCFIIEHLINVATGHEEPSLHATPFGPAQLSVDLILAENQMPFFVLVDLIARSKLPEFETTGYPTPVLLVKLVLYYLAGEKGRDMSEELPAAEDVSHVLHLLHMMITMARTRWEPPPHILDGGRAQAAWRLVRRLPSLVAAPLLYRLVPEGRRRRVREDVPSASEMKRMRVEFKKAYGGMGSNIDNIASVLGPVPLSVKLTRGVPGRTFTLDGAKDTGRPVKLTHGDQLQLPQLRLELRTAPLMLNLMAFEQSSRASMYMSSMDVSSYAAFMGKLVQSAEDAGLLLEAEVVRRAGNESMEEVTRFFRMVGDAASEAGGELETSYLRVTVERLKERTRSWAYVERNYYTFLAEFVALVTFVSSVSTILQTYAAFKYH